MVAKRHQNPEGGLNEAGRRHFERKEGGNLQRPLSSAPRPAEYLLPRGLPA